MNDTISTVLDAPPKWAHLDGSRVGYQFEPVNALELTFSSGPCHIKIHRLQDGKRWHVRWIIYHKTREHARYKVEGDFVMSAAELVTAFDLTRTKDETDAEYAAEHGADCGKPGVFIRKDRYLNIPCPGTGRDGDPNATFFLTDYAKGMIAKFAGIA